ncbi:MAG: hypothetical protein V1787_06105 [Candidatus Micrarchaeota archaeon]
MKGLASFVLLAFCALFVALLSFETGALRPPVHSAYAELALEQSRAAELEFRHAVSAALDSAEGASREERTALAAAMLASLEAFMEKRFHGRGVQADLWAGIASEAELKGIARKSLSAGRPVRCRLCFDLSAVSSGALVAQGFLDVSPAGRVLVSRTGSSFVPLLAAHSFSSKIFVLGASFHFPASGVSAVAVAEEGFP